FAKLHPFSPAGEHEHFTPGQDIVLFDWHAVKVAPLVCYDLRFPEIFRRAMLRGAQMLIVIANWPASRSEHWKTLLRARAIENQAYIVGVNRIGEDPNASYTGSSQIIDPAGVVLADAHDQRCVITAEIDLP